MNISKTNRPVAIVTGGASGLGMATAKKLCDNSIKTIIIGRNRTKLVKAQEELGPNCHYYAFDLNDLKNIPELIRSIIADHGKIDILVNNAGINMKKPFMEVTDEEFQQIITTNVSAVFSLSREVAKIMTSQKSGTIVNISSMASQYGIPKVIAYTASKSAIEGMTKAMAVELSPLGIRVNCVAPGFIATEMSAKALNGDPERKQKVLSRTPMGALGNPEHIADAVYYLASESASYVTGTVLPVDGGNSIGF
ncbi:glucose 1-dehydrogenase [Echinicola soli]|uniref:Glucose 1-dehydrogenase n=1 Tax=Echinicola soli TaxID=2591634 RepID=A0A514CH83_9BACT|nr:glucose 1-dehydrogenase [Echinicola soli]QDH79173.1 glucose 1-dehydrogenase [Echinicola soli]